MKVTLTNSPEGSPNFCFGLLDENGNCVEFVQSDWDYAALATRLGWEPCKCGQTDGTVDCEHRTASEMLAEAFDYLWEHDGEEIEMEDY